MKNIVFCALLVLCNSSQAQVVFQKAYGGVNEENGAFLGLTYDGGYVISTNTKSFGAGKEDFYVLRLNANGDTIWARSYGNVNSDYASCVLQTPDSGFIIGGVYDFISSPYTDIGMLVRTDKMGNVIWKKTYGNFGGTLGLNKVITTSDNGFLMVFHESAISANGFYNSYAVKTDNNGNIVWTKGFGKNSAYNYLLGAAEVADGYVFTGAVNSSGGDDGDVFLAKTNFNGDTLWTRMFGGPNGNWGQDIKVTHDGGLIVTGYTDSYGAGNFDIYLVRTDANGDLQWSKTFGGAG